VSARTGSAAPPGIRLDSLERWLDGQPNVGPLVGSLHVSVIEGGKSNLTYLLEDDESSWVLRRGPLGHTLPTASNMSREWRVLDALAATPVPVPRVLANCVDVAVLGVPFYVMERVEGRVVRDLSDARTMSEAEATRVSQALVSTLATLHRVDWQSVGLSTLGHPAGFLERQVRRWGDQWEGSATRPLAAVAELQRRLMATLPTEGSPALVHGDLRLDNVILDSSDPGAIRAVVDWEMSTIGDPLADLGTFLMYWCPSSGGPIIDIQAVTSGPGFASREKLVLAYTAAAGREVEGLNWYLGFAHYKLAVIVEGIHSRFLSGETVGGGFGGLGETVPLLIDAGMGYLGSTGAPS
jgi:aminoglycoside phosphotransferase (APT) family kinase protein